MLVVVIGDSADELVAAHCIARAGHEVTLVRKRDASAESGLTPGWMPPQVVKALELEHHGFATTVMKTWARVPLDGGGTLDLSADVTATAEAIRKLSAADAARWPAFCTRMHAIATFLSDLYCAPPPDPLASDLAELLHAARAGLRFRRLGREGMEDLLRVMPMSIADLLDEWFESDALKAALATTGVLNLGHGPRAGGTAFNFLHHHVGSPPGVFFPRSSNAHDVLRSLRGVHVREAPVTDIVARDDRVAGVVLASGEIIAADCVVSGLDPERTLVELCDPGLFDPQLLRAVQHVRSRGVAALLAFELASDPEAARFVLASSLDDIERASDDLKYRFVSGTPLIEAQVSTDESGRGRLEVRIQYLPYERDGQAEHALWASLVAHVRRCLSPYVSLIAEAPVVQAMTPRGLEAEYGFPQGQPYHAEIALDQMLWMRPTPELAQYRTPLAGLYLCGPAMHPGGPAVGAAGANAAAALLRDAKKRKKN
jgi:phytoene dehydrogenase-like protein